MNTKTKAQRINKRQDAIWDKAKRAQAETAAAAPEAPRKPSEYPDALYNKWTPKDTMTAKPAHTPGPWKIVRDSDEAEFSIRSNAFKTSDMMGDYQGVIVCDISRAIGGEGSRSHAIPEAEANARLIAAAPELLKAAKDGLAAMVAWGGKCEANGETILATRSVELAEEIRAAIAKAEGSDQ